MGKFDGLLFVSDLDGTLLRDDKTISSENKCAIKFFESEGGRFSFVTGRIPASVKPVLTEYTPSVPVGCVNGGCLYDCKKGEVVWSIELSREAIEIVRFVDESFPDVGIELTGFERIYFYKKNEVSEEHRIMVQAEDNRCHYSEVRSPLSKILFLDREDKIPSLIEAIKKHPLYAKFDFVRSTKEYYELLPKGASKGGVLLRLADYLGISHDKTISIGDNENDISMLKSARLGFAVANSSKNTKKYAHVLKESNEEHAIARVIEDLYSGKYEL